MSIIKEKIRFDGRNMNFKFSLGSNNNFIGFQQEIDSLMQSTTNDLINPAVDAEERRLKLNPIPSNTITLQFKFSNSALIDFTAAGFTQNEIDQNDTSLLNSYFILDFYDTYDINTQTKIFTTYLTKLSKLPIYSISTNNQLYYLYVPISYINGQTGTTVTGYTKFSFFNAKNGTTTLFYNENNESFTTPEKLFFKTELNLINNTWKFITPSYPIIDVKEIINNALYIKRINDTYDNFDNLQQTYPSGNTFTQLNGKGIYSDTNTTTVISTTPIPVPPIPVPVVLYYYLLTKCVYNGTAYYTGPLPSGTFSSGRRVQGGTNIFYVVSGSQTTIPSGTYIDVTDTGQVGCPY